jgi:hypothetical protein
VVQLRVRTHQDASGLAVQSWAAGGRVEMRSVVVFAACVIHREEQATLKCHAFAAPIATPCRTLYLAVLCTRSTSAIKVLFTRWHRTCIWMSYASSVLAACASTSADLLQLTGLTVPSLRMTMSYRTGHYYSIFNTCINSPCVKDTC